MLPTFRWGNSSDRDGDALTYGVAIYRDAALTDLLAQVTSLAPDASGTTSWTAVLPLVNHTRYYWRATATDATGAQISTAAHSFIVNTAPSAPVIASPAAGGQATTAAVALTISNSTDGEADLLTYVFELDTVNFFDSGNRRPTRTLATRPARRTRRTSTSAVTR